MDEILGEEIATVVAVLGARGWPSGSIGVREVRTLPGGWCLGLDVHSGDAAQPGVVWAARVDGDALPGTEVVEHAHGRFSMWEYPHDPELPGLAAAVTPGALSDLLPGIDHEAVTAISLTPLTRAVVRIGRPGAGAVVKVLPPAVLGEVHHEVIEIHHRLHAAGIPAPEVLAVDLDRGLLALAEIPGTPLTVRLESGGPLPAVAELWSLINRLSVVHIDRDSPAPSVVSSFQRAAMRLTAAAPHLGARLERLGDIVTPPGPSGGVVTTVHGDLHGRQILLGADGRVVGLVDLDDVGRGDLADDLGRLVAHLMARSVTHPSRRHAADSLVRGFLDALAGVMEPAEVCRRAAMSMVMLADAARGMPPGSRPAEPVDLLVMAEVLAVGPG